MFTPIWAIRSMPTRSHSRKVAVPRPPQRRAGDGVDLVDRVTVVEHQPDGVLHGKAADAVGHEARRILALDSPLAQHRLGKPPEVFDPRRIAVGGGNQLQQGEIAGRIEEMRAEEPAAVALARALGNQVQRNPRRIAGHNRVGRHDGFDLAVQLLFHVQSFHDGLDHPVDVGQQIEVVVEVAQRHARRHFRQIQRRGLELQLRG